MTYAGTVSKCCKLRWQMWATGEKALANQKDEWLDRTMLDLSLQHHLLRLSHQSSFGSLNRPPPVNVSITYKSFLDHEYKVILQSFYHSPLFICLGFIFSPLERELHKNRDLDLLTAQQTFTEWKSKLVGVLKKEQPGSFPPSLPTSTANKRQQRHLLQIRVVRRKCL